MNWRSAEDLCRQSAGPDPNAKVDDLKMPRDFEAPPLIGLEPDAPGTGSAAPSSELVPLTGREVFARTAYRQGITLSPPGSIAFDKFPNLLRRSRGEEDGTMAEIEIEELLEEQSERAVSRSAAGPERARQQASFDPSMASRKAALQAELLRGSNDLIAAVRKRGGAKFADLDAAISIRVGRVGVRGAGKVMDAILAQILTPTGAAGTQTAIRSRVAAMFPGLPIPKDWTKPLPMWGIVKLKRRLAGSGAPFSSLKPVVGWSLGALHREARAALAYSEDGCVTFKAEVALGDGVVVINGVSFKIRDNLVKGVSYPATRIPLAKLRQALMRRA